MTEETQFPIAKEGFIFIAGGAFFTLLGGLFLGPAAGWFFGTLTLFCVWFFRDPRRSVPQTEGALVSPADGKVVDISRTEEGRFLNKPAIKISIFLNVFNVHINRVPVAGKVIGVFYNAGRFFAANVPKASLENEQNAVVMEMPSGKRVVCIQIAGLIARRIVCWIKEGSVLNRGERFGLIRFGSRVDLFLPIETEIRVSMGQKVRGGETILGILR
ncbi:MAG: phosphatidylserine decarboxylase family protein [Candidatus Manganitrophus sp.]|nr:phosphatidylserine decarboxylase family protein [Candidatus Manganitrophus sp.]MDC4224754.1 phosphatidylserine decarboxylase family protein [Candidatus Manganitrophus sp.]WDT70346.1 MAG: phosphatidylserine decarboxylase family protein [Candidatus Manganitrophus sp.]WDT82426.1 MAG: phosphatidylserine decarboxylase family protein [Candidatus Manganitrophus sp.]